MTPPNSSLSPVNSPSSDSPHSAKPGLVELVTAIVHALAAGEVVGEVVNGQPTLRLAGERVGAASLLAALRERALASQAPPPLDFEPALLERHGRASDAPDGYFLSAAGSCERVEGSLRFHRSCLGFALNAMLRARPKQPADLLAIVEGLRRATQRHLQQDERPFIVRLERLSRQLEGLVRLDDPRLPRLLAELFVHASLAIAAVEGARPLVRTLARPDESPAWLHRLCELPADQLEALREAAADPRRSWFDTGLLSATPEPEPEPCEWFGSGAKRCKIEIRPHYRSSAGRWLDDEAQVLFPPGVRFAVRFVKDEDDRTSIGLAERSRLAAHLAERPLPPEHVDRPLYHYTVGRALPSIVADDEIGVAEALPGTDAPVVWLSTAEDWERSAVKSVVEDGVRRELSPTELRNRCDGLFRIRVDPGIGALSWARFAAFVQVAPRLVEMLDERGRERGAEPNQWYCCPWSIPRVRWQSVEMWSPEFGWVALEL